MSTGYYKDLLPLGSVVLLEGGEKRLLIIGRVQSKVGDAKVYDYTGIYYPEGMMSSENIFFFDRSAIKEVFFVGYQDDEELQYQDKMLAQLPELEVIDGKMEEKRRS